jgi:hypothetical protein
MHAPRVVPDAPASVLPLELDYGEARCLELVGRFRPRTDRLLVHLEQRLLIVPERILHERREVIDASARLAKLIQKLALGREPLRQHRLVKIAQAAPV